MINMITTPGITVFIQAHLHSWLPFINSGMMGTVNETTSMPLCLTVDSVLTYQINDTCSSLTDGLYLETDFSSFLPLTILKLVGYKRLDFRV